MVDRVQADRRDRRAPERFRTARLPGLISGMGRGRSGRYSALRSTCSEGWDFRRGPGRGIAWRRCATPLRHQNCL